MDIVKASPLSPCLRPVTFVEEKQGFGFVFATRSRFEVGQNLREPKFFFLKSSFQRVEHRNFLRSVRSFGTYILLFRVHIYYGKYTMPFVFFITFEP